MDSSKICISRMIVISGLLIFLFSIDGVSQEIKRGNSTEPEVKYDVKKEYDRNGNIIQYDSTYSYSWSGNNLQNVNIDSVFNSLRLNFPIDINFEGKLDNFWPFGGDSIFSEPFTFPSDLSGFPFDINPRIKDSSLLKKQFDYFDKDFQEIFKQQQKLIEKLMYRMDAMDSFDIYLRGDSIPEQTSKQQAKPQKQNYNQSNKSSRTIII